MTGGTIVVPLDGSELAEQGLPMAVALAREEGVVLHLLHVRRAVVYDTAEADEAAAYMDRVSERIRRGGVDVHVEIVPDEPPQLLLPTPSPKSIAQTVVDHAVSRDADVIVMTTHGRGGISRKWFGSVADGLIRMSPVPLLLVKPTDADDRGTPDPTESPLISRVLVAVAPDDQGVHVVSTANSIVGSFRPHFTLLRVLPLPYTVTEGVIPATVVLPAMDLTAREETARLDLEQQKNELPDGSADVVTLIEDAPAHGILEYAADHDIDLIVVGTHSRRGFERVMLGSVADKVMRGANTCVLVVPP